MGQVGVPGSSGDAPPATVGLGIQDSGMGARKELPFKVVPTPQTTEGPEGHCGCGACAREKRRWTAGAARRRRLRWVSRKAKQATKTAFRLALVLSLQLLVSLSPMAILLEASYGPGANNLATTRAASRPCPRADSNANSGANSSSDSELQPPVATQIPSRGSSLSVLAFVTSGSRFVEHVACQRP